MTPRERFRCTMHFEPVDRIPLWEWGPWSQTVRRWRSEGMPGERGVPQFAECDPRSDCGIDFAPVPRFEKQILTEDDSGVTYINEIGQTIKNLHEWELSMPHFIDYPVHNRAEWEQLTERFNPDSPKRYPADWESRLTRWEQNGVTLHLMGDRNMGFFGPLRERWGPVNLMMVMMDEPGLVHEMMEFLADFFIRVMRRALAEAPIEWVIFWEDMAYTHGSLISPEMFRQFMMPNYRKVTDFIRSHGIDIIGVDSDGNVEKLIPLWLEVGINLVYPMEVQAGMDVVALRKKYGHDLRMTGGFDKGVLAQGKAAIDAELARVMPLIEGGGYIPTIDHSIPPDVPYENFAYYWERKKEWIGL